MRWNKIFGLLLLAALARVALGGEDGLQPADLKGVLVFAREHQGQWDIWTMRADGSALTQLTRDPHRDADPTWSPDGRSILYTSLRSGIPRIMRMAQDGAGAEELGEGQNPAWAPDGQAIAFARDGEIILHQLGDDSERRLTPEAWDRCAYPAFAPAGDRIACSSRHGPHIALYLVPLAGGTDAARTQPVDTGKESCTPSWRPDGRRLLYQTSRHLQEIEPDAGRPNEQLTFGGDIQSHGRYSPDGQMIVFNRAAAVDGPWTLHVLELASEREVQLPVTGSVLYADWKADEFTPGQEVSK